MSENRGASHGDNQDFQPSSVTTIWFDIVNRHIQHRSDEADEDIVKAEHKQAAPPETSY
jgi:hypothetical protein